MAQAAKAIVSPGERIVFQYTTSSHQAAEEARRGLMKIHVTDTDGEAHELEGLDGWRVMEVIRDWGLGIKAECGGSCSCATCHVYVGEAGSRSCPSRATTRRTSSSRRSTRSRTRG